MNMAPKLRMQDTQFGVLKEPDMRYLRHGHGHGHGHGQGVFIFVTSCSVLSTRLSTDIEVLFRATVRYHYVIHKVRQTGNTCNMHTHSYK
jgi:hypothetical protein